MSYPQQVLHWINDAEVPSTGGESFEKRCPIDNRIVAHVARGNAVDVARAVDAAAAAAPAWSAVPAPKRGAILGRAAQLLREREQLFGTIVQVETGKPWKNAIAEVSSSADLGVFMEGEGSRFYGKTMPSPI
ncbi:MAG: aldehyde dehydrogenase family protein, partial [Vicinamibacterales bacterium]